MGLFSRDTSPEVREYVIAQLRTKTPAEKLEMVERANRMMRQLTWAGVKRRMPDASPEEREAEYARLILGEKDAARWLAARGRDGAAR